MQIVDMIFGLWRSGILPGNQRIKPSMDLQMVSVGFVNQILQRVELSGQLGILGPGLETLVIISVSSASHLDV